MVTYIRLSGLFQCWVYFSLKGSAASLARARYNIFWQKLFYIFGGFFLFFSSKIMQIKCQLKSCLSSSLFNTIHIYIIKNMLQNSHAFNWFIPSISKLSDFSIFDLHFTLQVIVLSRDFPLGLTYFETMSPITKSMSPKIQYWISWTLVPYMCTKHSTSNYIRK